MKLLYELEKCILVINGSKNIIYGREYNPCSSDIPLENCLIFEDCDSYFIKADKKNFEFHFEEYCFFNERDITPVANNKKSSIQTKSRIKFMGISLPFFKRVPIWIYDGLFITNSSEPYCCKVHKSNIKFIGNFICKEIEGKGYEV